MAKRNNLNIKYVIKDNKIVEAFKSFFDTIPRNSRIKGIDCKSDLINVYKNVNSSTSFNKINNSSFNTYINSNLKITSIPPRNSGVSFNCNNFVEKFNTFNLLSQSLNTDGNCSDFFQ